MGVKIRKRGGKWYVFVNYHGRRKAKCVGSSRLLAEQVKRQLEAKLALGDLGFLGQDEKQVPTFKDYAKNWLSSYADLQCKPSTAYSYAQLLRLHVTPRFGDRRLPEITRDDVKLFLSELSQATRVVNEIAVPKFSRNTLRLVVCVLRAVMSAAVEDGLIEANPASKLGRFTKSEKPVRQASAMSRVEAEQFLASVKEFSPDLYPLFLMALRAGLRKGELIAVKWGDVQFGNGEDDSNRYLLVQRNFVHGKFTSPKSKKSRRVDLSRELRRVLIELRDARLLAAMMVGKASIADDLIFPSKAGTVLDPNNLVHYHFLPCLEHAGLRRFRFHDLRHTFGSLLIQDGAPLAYVKEQMGHSSIQITVDTYGHLIPGADINWIDGLDRKSSPQQNATPAQPETAEAISESPEVVEGNGERGRNRTYNLLIKSQLLCQLSYAPSANREVGTNFDYSIAIARTSLPYQRASQLKCAPTKDEPTRLKRLRGWAPTTPKRTRVCALATLLYQPAAVDAPLFQ
jgi:integrase